MSIKIDNDSCIGCGVCASICPDSFEMTDDGKVKVISESECAKNAADSCPVQAIEVE